IAIQPCRPKSALTLVAGGERSSSSTATRSRCRAAASSSPTLRLALAHGLAFGVGLSVAGLEGIGLQEVLQLDSLDDLLLDEFSGNGFEHLAAREQHGAHLIRRLVDDAAHLDVNFPCRLLAVTVLAVAHGHAEELSVRRILEENATQLA